MALQDVLLVPLGLLGVGLAIPLIVLYLVQPDPLRARLPTLRFLAEEERIDAETPLLRRLRRHLLLLLQVLAIVLLSVALAGPYVTVAEETTISETVLVVDDSASMATTDGTEPRFARAIADAKTATTSSTSVVRTTGRTDAVLRDGSPSDAGAALDALQVVETSGDLRSAVAAAASIAGEDARVLVFSDFADDTDWRGAVRAARARNVRVELRQFDGGGADNVGIVSRSFSGTSVTVSVKNYGDDPAERTVSLGDERRRLRLDAGVVRSVTLPVPPGESRVELAPRDSFPTDDVLPVAAPADETVDVVLVTNDRNRYLTTALSVAPAVSLTVKTPPTTIEAGYDVVIYGDVGGERLLRSNVEAGREVLAEGGGVAVLARTEFPDRYGDLLLIDPGPVRTNPVVARVAEDELTRGLTFAPPEEYVTGPPLEGVRVLAAFGDGTPLLATAQRGEGRVLYYGYLEERSSFKFNYQYPVFWKRAVYHLAGRSSLSDLNRATGGRLEFTEARTVRTPRGSVTARSVPVDAVGLYEFGDRRIAAGLVSESESNVTAPSLETGGPGGIPTRQEPRPVPQRLTPAVALLALAVVLGEIGYLRYRGDL